MADEVNDMLQSAGRVVVAELSRQFNLPMEFLVEVSHPAHLRRWQRRSTCKQTCLLLCNMQEVESRMGRGINGHFERSDQLVVYTEAYMSRYRSRIRGYFNAATHPVAVASVIERGDFQERLFLCERWP